MRAVLSFLFLLLAFFSFPVAAADFTDTYSKDEIGYDKFFSVQGDFKLVMKDNDLYVYDIEGAGKRRITHTPKLNKPMASFSKDRGYILYAEYTDGGVKGGELRYYRTKFENDDNSRSRISKEEYDALSGK
ncbi:MAG: hypothetical protein M0R20_03525 [Candidatus Omnitrophica bacterium]|jgi:hypothetical protein|nr:hypothetical protein [Candidatus Omnitrophota bacterium]